MIIYKDKELVALAGKRKGETFHFKERVLVRGHYETLRNHECCGQKFRFLNQLLRHLDKAHDIHIAYVRGVVRKRVFLDGI